MVASDGESEMDTILAAVTVNGTDCVADPKVAVIVTSPGARPTTKPLLAPMFTTAGSDTDQVAWCVTSRVPPSLNVPIADN